MISAAILGLFALLTCAAIVFYVIGLVALRDFKKQSRPANGTSPPVSILKPLKGCDPEMYEALRSHCNIEYPDFELIFGVSSTEDEAAPFVRRLMEEFPQRRIQLVVCANPIGMNRKVSNLAQMTRAAAHGILVVNDSDITVPTDYLKKIMPWFSDSKIGLVTCLYRAKAGKGLWSHLESLGVCSDFIPGTLTSRLLEGGVHFGLGSTLAVRREALERAGGFETLADFLADDYELARSVIQAKYEVKISELVVETMLPDYSFKDFWDHQIRWGRTVRSSRPAGYFGMVVTFGFLWALGVLIFSVGAKLAWMLLGFILAFRIITTALYGRLLRDSQSVRLIFLLPFRDVISPLVWLFSLFGRRIVWRGEVFELDKGRLKRP